MLLEDLVLVVAVAIVGLLVVWPIVRAVKGASWRRRDPLAEAHERLRVAKVDAEVARVNRETERIYESLYDESLADEGGERSERSEGEKGNGNGHQG